jgi:ABC-2 type transport system permease protein
MTQAFLGNGYVYVIVDGEVTAFAQHHRADAILPVEPEVRVLFNPNLSNVWSGSVMELINSITALSLILTGAALILEREHGTIEHLLVMPLTPFEIIMAKVWSMGLVGVVMATVSLVFVVQGWLEAPIQGSIALFATTSLGILLGTLARSMQQLGLLMVITVLPLQIRSGGMTPFESMPDWVQKIMQVAPITQFVSLAQAIVYAGPTSRSSGRSALPCSPSAASSSGWRWLGFARASVRWPDGVPIRKCSFPDRGRIG